MTSIASETDAERAERHAAEAERLLKSQFIWSYVKAEAHATLALYYAARQVDQS